MKRIGAWLLGFLLLSAITLCWLFLFPATTFTGKSAYFIIPEDQTGKVPVLDIMKNRGIISSTSTFSLTGSVFGVWNRIRPGKYEVKKGATMASIARMLKNGRLATVRLVINRIRTKEDLAHLIGKNFAADSASVMAYISDNDSLKGFGVDTSTLFTMLIPDTYSFYWNTPLSRIFRKLADTRVQFWRNKGRAEKAQSIGLTQDQVYILASIVDEETNYESDKLKIASVYENRLIAGMPLQACPTIKYAMKNFTLTRIYEKYLFNPSPYNTYRHKGLPPGPICTPSPRTIDLVLNAPKTDYLFFVAKSDFSGYHHFSSSFAEHSQYAREYQKALDEYMARKQQNEPQH